MGSLSPWAGMGLPLPGTNGGPSCLFPQNPKGKKYGHVIHLAVYAHSSGARANYWAASNYRSRGHVSQRSPARLPQK